MLVRVFIAYLMIAPTYAIFILSNTSTPHLFETEPEVLVSLSCFLLVIWLYAFVVFGHNPKRSYQQLVSHAIRIRNAWH